MKPELPPNGATFKQAMNEPVYTADQMRAFYAEGFRAGMERAARMMDLAALDTPHQDVADRYRREAAAIRGEAERKDER